MNRSLKPENIQEEMERLEKAHKAFSGLYPGPLAGRQPVHTVYGGAHLFRSATARRLGQLALRALDEFAPDFVAFARAIGLPDSCLLPDSPDGRKALERDAASQPERFRKEQKYAWLANTIYRRVRQKLESEPVEDFRIDFEDGYGNRPNAEEDGHAESVAGEVVAGMAARELPPFIGIRIKPLSEELRERSVRTLDMFLTAVLGKTGGKLPNNFVITLPKVTLPEEVAALSAILEKLERAHNLAAGSLRVELMIETTQAILSERGAINLLPLVSAARGRCVAAHFGTYDYTAACGITAAHQQMTHPVCDFAKQMMQVALAGTGVWLSDGATNVMPVAPHRAPPGGPLLTKEQAEENRAAVHRAWRLHFGHVQHSLVTGFYQGWDLHPAQLPTRYAAVYSFFLEGLDAASERLRNFVAKAAQATLAGEVFDDAATGQGLLNYFLRAINCGTISEAEALPLAGLALEELRLGSFAKIIQRRKANP